MNIDNLNWVQNKFKKQNLLGGYEKNSIFGQHWSILIDRLLVMAKSSPFPRTKNNTQLVWIISKRLISMLTSKPLQKYIYYNLPTQSILFLKLYKDS